MREALAALASGGVVAAATESSFGLLADIENPLALERLLSLKPRGADKGQPLMVPDVRTWHGLVTHVPPEAERLAARLWPGGLTIVLPARADVDPHVQLGGTVAVRIPGQSPAAILVRAYGKALTATSANPPGGKPALTSTELAACFPEAVRAGKLWVLPGTAPGGPPSTIVGMEGGCQVLREGAVGRSSIERALRS